MEHWVKRGSLMLEKCTYSERHQGKQNNHSTFSLFSCVIFCVEIIRSNIKNADLACC